MSFYPSTCSGRKHWAVFCLPCLICGLLPGFVICLCEFLIRSCLLCFSFRPNWVQGNSRHQSTQLYPLLQIRGLTAFALWMCPVLGRNMFDHILLRSAAVSIFGPSFTLSDRHSIWPFSRYCASGLQISPGFIRNGAFISFHIILLALRVNPHVEKEEIISLSTNLLFL